MNEILSAIAAHGDTVGIGALYAATLAVIFRGLATGAIVFRKQLEELRADKDAEIARLDAANDAELERTIAYYDKLGDLKEEQAKLWHDAYQNEAVARRDQGRSLDEQLELARAADHMLRAIPKKDQS